MSWDLIVERRLAVGAAVAFRHWVDPEAQREWYRGDEDDWVVTAHTDLRVGGRFVVRWGPSTEDAYEESGVFEVVEPPHRLVYSSRYVPRPGEDANPFELHVTVTFDAVADGTILRIAESGFPSREIRDAFSRAGIQQGLDFFERTLPT